MLPVLGALVLLVGRGIRDGKLIPQVQHVPDPVILLFPRKQQKRSQPSPSGTQGSSSVSLVSLQGQRVCGAGQQTHPDLWVLWGLYLMSVLQVGSPHSVGVLGLWSASWDMSLQSKDLLP